ncbi:MAG: hypothetical protein JKY70_17595 [Mucilaginibacter sp.]|nr:hypothetical protein [Mucilaginibacter sp.]
MSEDSLLKKITDSGIIIASLTAGIYFFSQLYQTRRAELFQYPSFMVETDIGNLVDFASKFGMMVLLYFMFGSLIFLAIKRIFLVPNIFAYLVMLVNCIMFSLYSTIEISSPIHQFAEQQFIYFNGFIFLYLTIRRIIKYRKGDSSLGYQPLSNTYSIFYWIGTFVFLCGVSIQLGVNDVSSRNNFFVTRKNVIVVGKYKDFMIGKPYNPKTGKLSDSVLLIKSDESTIVVRKNIPNLEIGKRFFRLNEISL